MTTIAKPQPGMFRPFSGAYISLVNDDVTIDALQTEFESLTSFLLSVPKEKWNYRYAEGKWTLKEMLLHMIDAERIFSYRALRIARNDGTALPGFEQDDYVPFSEAGNRTSGDLIEEFTAVRRSTYLLFRSFDDSVWDRYTLVDNHPVSVRAILYIIIGHAKHHVKVMREKYL